MNGRMTKPFAHPVSAFTEHPSHEEQRQLALSSLKDVRSRHKKDATGGSGGDGGGEGRESPVKTLAMRSGSYFEPAPLEEQKAEFQRRDELKEPFKGNASTEGWLLESQTAAKLNGYLSGGCMSRPWWGWLQA